MSSLKSKTLSVFVPALVVSVPILIPFSNLVQIVGLIGIGFFGWKMSFETERSRIFKDTGMRWLCVGFLILWLPMLLSLVDAELWQHGLLKALGQLRFIFAAFLVVYFLTAENLKRSMLLLIAVLLFWSFDAFYEVITKSDWLGREQYPNRINGPFDRPKLGYFLSLLLLVPSVWLWMRNRWIGAITFFCLVATVFVSGDRGGWLHLFWAIVIPCFFAVIFRPSRIFKFTVLGALLLMQVFVAYSFVDSVKQRMDRSVNAITNGFDSFMTKERAYTELSTVGITMFEKHPVNGIGFRGYRHLYNDYAEPNQMVKGSVSKLTGKPQGYYHAHSNLLLFAAEMGSIGLISLFAVIGASLYCLWITIRDRMFLASAGWASWVSILFPLGFQRDIGSSEWGMFAWFIFGLAIALYKIELVSRAQPD